MTTSLWLAWRYFLSMRKTLNLTAVLSLLGMTLGVACLVVSMSVFSGFEATLRKAVIDVVGHATLLKGGLRTEHLAEITARIHSLEPDVVASSPFVRVEAIAANRGKISNVLVEGIDPKSAHKVLNLESRVRAGPQEIFSHLDPDPKNSPKVQSAYIGKSLARKLQLSVGDSLLIVVPEPSPDHVRPFIPKKSKFHIAGILDLGKYEFDERMILAALPAVQEIGGVGSGISGIRVRMKEDLAAIQKSGQLARQLGDSFVSISWFDVNQNLFHAIALEKPVIFLVVLIIVITAAFNISTTLFISVIRRYRDIGILKACGMNRHSIVTLFCLQGLCIGLLGSLLGVGLGILFNFGFEWLQRRITIFPADVYKLDFVMVDVRLSDFLGIVIASLTICFLATLAPALRGSKLAPVEGLHYE